MRVLVACERFGAVRDAFRALGHDAYSCDLAPSEPDSQWHMQCDVRETLADGWDLMVAFPECTFICGSGLHRNRTTPGREEKTQDALDFVARLLLAPIRQIALENPVGKISTAIRRPDQIIQPYQFGADASKRTALWLKNLSKLRPTAYVAPRMVNGLPRWANQTDSGQNRMAPGPRRSIERARTFPGIAQAMADQWGRS